jgi:hypothetical protein
MLLSFLLRDEAMMHGNEHGVFVDLSKTSSALHRMSDTELQGLLGSAWYVTLVFVIHVGGTRCVTSSTGNSMNIQARITLKVEFIRTRIFLFLFYV